jgi:hypothetical protein
MAKPTTMVLCPIPPHEGEPPHTQIVLGTDYSGAWLLECTVCHAVEVPARSEVYRNIEEFHRGHAPLDLKNLYPAAKLRR